jgi:hypothetical protein
MLIDGLETFREEYGRDGIGPQLHKLLEKVVWSTVRLYPAREYSPDGTWDRTACEDVLHDWVAERLWGRADLQAMLLCSATTAQLRAALTTSLRQHLTNKRRRSITSNLYKRTRAALRAEPTFTSMGSGAEERWALSEADHQAPSLRSAQQLVDVACELSDEDLEVVRYGPFSQKLSPILRDPQLITFLQHLLRGAEGSLTVNQVIDVMRHRFSLPTEEHTELDVSTPAPAAGPLTEAMVAVSARSVVSRLDIEDAELVRAYFAAGGSFSDAATMTSRPTTRIREVVGRCFQMICDCAESAEDAGTIMTNVESLLRKGGD